MAFLTKPKPEKNKRQQDHANKSIDSFTIRFIMKLGSALHQYGTPAHRLEEALSILSQRLGIEANFLSTPTSIMGAFGPIGKQQTSLIRIEPGEANLAKMVALDEVANAVIIGKMSMSKASKKLDAITASSSPYPTWLFILCYGVASGAASTFFGGSWYEIGVSSLIGLIIGILSKMAEHRPPFQRILVILASVIAAIIATVSAHFSVQLSFYIPLVAGLIYLMPGLTLTVAMTELATRNLVSGSARLMSAIMTFIEMAFGVALVVQLSLILSSSTPAYFPTPLPWWSQWVALIIAAMSFTVLFHARPKDIGWIVLAGAIGYGAARLGTASMGLELGAFFGALMVGTISNIYARMVNRPSAVLMLPGILFLVPGSIGFRSISYLLERDVLTGIETAFSVAIIAVSLVAGLLMANVLIHPRKSL